MAPWLIIFQVNSTVNANVVVTRDTAEEISFFAADNIADITFKFGVIKHS
jgi:hypothetical protein